MKITLLTLKMRSPYTYPPELAKYHYYYRQLLENEILKDEELNRHMICLSKAFLLNSRRNDQIDEDTVRELFTGQESPELTLFYMSILQNSERGYLQISDFGKFGYGLNFGVKTEIAIPQGRHNISLLLPRIVTNPMDIDNMYYLLMEHVLWSDKANISSSTLRCKKGYIYPKLKVTHYPTKEILPEGIFKKGNCYPEIQNQLEEGINLIRAEETMTFGYWNINVGNKKDESFWVFKEVDAKTNLEIDGHTQERTISFDDMNQNLFTFSEETRNTEDYLTYLSWLNTFSSETV